jgi:hypothetical protein
MNLTLYAGNIYKTIFRFLRHMEVWRPTRGKNCHQKASLSLLPERSRELAYSLNLPILCNTYRLHTEENNEVNQEIINLYSGMSL